MAKTETLNLEVKSNIKSVTKDQKDWNKELGKTKQNIEGVNEEGKEVVAEMQILGVSINGLKTAWDSAASGAKFLFNTVKSGIISTGVGALLVAFGTLATWFTKTKKGAELLSVAFKGIGAAINVVIDRISKFGGGLAKILSGNIRAGLSDMSKSFKSIGDEIVADTLLAMAFEKQLISLTDSERALRVETAQRRAEIEKLKMTAEDVTKSEEERLKAAKDAFAIENELLEKRTANAEEAVRLQQSQNDLNESMAEDLDALADKEIALANIQGESATKQIELNNKINAIEAETKARRDTAYQERLVQIEEEKKAELEKLEAIAKAEEERYVSQADGLIERQARITALQEENYLAELEDLRFQEEEKLRLEKEKMDASFRYRFGKQEERIALDENFRIRKEAIDKKYDDIELQRDKAVNDAKVGMAHNALGAMAALAGDNVEAGKAIAVAQTIFATQQSIMSAMSGGGTDNALPYWVRLGNAISAGIMGAKSIQTILSTSPDNLSGATATVDGSATPAPQMMSGAFELGSLPEEQPVQAYVVSDDITDSQNGLAVIRRRATI